MQLDPLTACTDVTFVQYDPTGGAFSYVSHRPYIQELATSTRCTTPELADAIQNYCPPTLPIPYYLASLLLGDISDVPIPAPNATLFGNPALINSHLNTEFASTTAGFLTVGRAVRLLYEHKPLQEILQDHAAPIEAYVTSLAACCPTHAGLLEQLMTRNDAAASIAKPHDANPFHHTLTLLDEYLAAGDWDGLRELAFRSCDLPDPAAAAVAKRMLALCLARSSARADRDAATDLYWHLADSAHARADDWAALAALLTDSGRHEEAKAAIRDGVRVFPQQGRRFHSDRHEDRRGHGRPHFSRRTTRPATRGDPGVSADFSSFKVGIEFESVLRAISKQIYETPHAFIRENVQNAIDAVRIQALRDGLDPGHDSYRIEVVVDGSSVSVRDNGIGMSRAHLRDYFWTIGSSGKRGKEAHDAGCVGMFGIGGLCKLWGM